MRGSHHDFLICSVQDIITVSMNTLRKKQQRGFTIVELLIVIVIIGILAALAIAAYNGIQNRAYDTTIRTDLSNVGKKIKAHIIQNGAAPKGSSQLAALDIKIGKNAYSRGFNNGTAWYNFLYCWPNAANPEDFALIAQSKSGNTFEYNSKGSVKQVSYAFSGGSVSICSSANNAMDTGSERDFFYDADTWMSYVGS